MGSAINKCLRSCGLKDEADLDDKSPSDIDKLHDLEK